MHSSRPASSLQRVRCNRPQVHPTPSTAIHPSRPPHSQTTFAPRSVTNMLLSVHTCPATPCFRCRLPGHRAKDCSNRRWPKDMCWRCLRTDMCECVPVALPLSPWLQALALGLHSRPSSHAHAITQSHRMCQLRPVRSCTLKHARHRAYLSISLPPSAPLPLRPHHVPALNPNDNTAFVY